MDYSQLLPPKKKILLLLAIIEDIVAPKFQLEDAEKLHRLLTLDNPLTYMVFLEKRPDLSEEDKEIIYEIIRRLQENEALEYKLSMEKMIDPLQEDKIEA